jgi:signal peptidase II
VAHRYLPLALGVGAVVVLVDQLTKWWAEDQLAQRSIDLVWTLRLHLVRNNAAAFSLGEGFGPFIGVLALGVVGILLWTGRSIGSRLGAVGLGLVLGGALGNILDRAFRSGDGVLGGSVVDWIDVQWWPVFNVADIGVVVGAGLLFVATFRQEQTEHQAADPSGDPDDTGLEQAGDASGAAGPERLPVSEDEHPTPP